MSEKHINKSPIPCQSDSTKSPLPQHDWRLGVGIMPQGYKQTSIGIIPQDWEVVRLGEVGDIVGGGTPDTTNPAFWNGEILWLTPTEIKQKYISTSERKITQKGLENSSAKILPKNTILITTRATIGDIGIATKQLCTNQGFQSFVSGKNANFEFMYYLLCTKRSQFISLANGSTFLEVSAKTIRQIQIPLPPLKEQEKIARILGVWDSALDTLANLIKAKRKYKTALMQRLLTPPKDKSTHPLAPSAREGEQENSLQVNDRESQSSLRFAGFSDKWQEFRLGDLLKEKNIRNANNVNLVLSVTNKQGFVAQKDYFEQEVASNDTSNYKVVCRGEFAYNPARINVGSIAMLENFENGILSPMYIVFECLEKINKDFFRYWLESHNFRGILGRYLSGSVRETLSFNDMKTMKIFIPTLAEQKKIAQVLSACDKEIETLNLKFECLKAQKRGLMQQLLSGKVRVKC